MDTLAKASSMQVAKPDSAHSEVRNSEEHSNNASVASARNSKSSADQPRENRKSADRNESVIKSRQKADSKQSQSADEAANEKSTEKKADQAYDKPNSKKSSLAAQVASPTALQDSTAQSEISGRSFVPVAAADNDSQVASGDSTEQPTGTDSTGTITGHGFHIQGQPGVTGPLLFTAQQDSSAGQGNSSSQCFGVFKADGSSVGQLETGFVGVGQLADPKATVSNDGQTSISDSSSANAVTTIEQTSAIEASLTARNQAEFAIRPGDGRISQSAVKSSLSKLSAPTTGLNSNAGAVNSATKSDGSSDDRSSAHVVGIGSLQDLSNQSSNAHGASAGSEGVAVQQFVIAQPTESHSTAGLQSTSGSGEGAAYQGNGSEVVSAEQGVGNQTAGMSGISAARLIQTIGTSEMRVGMHSAEFGDISIRTSVAQQQMKTQISVDHGELGNALAAHIPNVQAKLGSEYGLHATIEVNQSGTSFSSDGDRSQQHQHQARTRRAEIVDGPGALQSDIASFAGSTSASLNSRLDIRA